MVKNAREEKLLIRTSPRFLRQKSGHHLLLAEGETVQDDVGRILRQQVVAAHNIFLWLSVTSPSCLPHFLATPSLILHLDDERRTQKRFTLKHTT